MHYHGCVYVTRKTYITYMRPCGIFCMHNRGLRVFSDSDELSAEACGLGFKQWGEKCEGATGKGNMEESRERRERILPGLVSSALTCCCTGDGYPRCSSHIITFIHFCLVSKSTEASTPRDRQQKTCREASSGGGSQITVEINTKSINEMLWEALAPLQH